MAWPQKVLRQFQLVPPNADENAYCGPWNKLLYILFPADSDFTVVPNYQELGSTQGADPSIAIDVYIGTKSVLIVELKKPNNLHYVSRREDADKQLRRRMRDLVHDCPIHALCGVSVFGPKVRFYSLSTVPGSPINPPPIPRDPDYVNDMAPEDRWNDNVLDASGEDKLRQVVGEIFDASSNIDLSEELDCV